MLHVSDNQQLFADLLLRSVVIKYIMASITLGVFYIDFLFVSGYTVNKWPINIMTRTNIGGCRYDGAAW